MINPKTKLLQTNGTEPLFDATKWNSAKTSLVEKANCYAYFLQDYRDATSQASDVFPQPGAFADRLSRRRITGSWLQNNNFQFTNSSSSSSVKKNLNTTLRVSAPYTCDSLVKAVLADNRSIFATDRLAICPKNYYKGFAAVDSRNGDSDFHFWIQHKDGFWSHKPGELDATDRDSDNLPILDPLISNRGRYTDACGYFCIPHNRHKPTFAAADAQ